MKTPQTLSETECEKLLDHLHYAGPLRYTGPTSLRNYTIALLMLDTGIRVGELVQLHMRHLWLGNLPVESLIITADIAKCHVQRIVPLTTRLQKAIIDLHRHTWNIFAGHPLHFAFFRFSPRSHLTARQVQRILKFAGLASIGRPVNPHMLRHTFASKMMRITSSRVLQELLGHRQLSSTQVYTHPNSDDLHNAVKALESSKPNTNSQQT